MGYSTIINDTSAFSMKLFARDAANLMDALNIPKAHIMGWSMGTYTVQELALGYPEKVDKVILYAADCGDSITIQPDPSICQRQDAAIKNWFTQGGGSTDRLGNFGKKTFLITGDQDICTPWKNTLIMQPLIEGCNILILPGGGHGVMY